MSVSGRSGAKQDNTNANQKAQPAAKNDHRSQLEEVAFPLEGQGMSAQDQAVMLKRLGRPQRQQALSRIGRLQGNRHVQRVIDSLNGASDAHAGVRRRAINMGRQASGRPSQPVKLTQPNGEDHISRREATWVERRAWLSFFDHYLPRRFLNNYMDDTGAEITLTQQEMVDCNPTVDVRRIRNRQLQNEVARLRGEGGGSAALVAAGTGGALTNGTLGNFTINYTGTLTVTAEGGWRFEGTMNFYDFWDFDPKPFGGQSGRPAFAEIRVRAAHHGLPGRPFRITSVDVPVRQNNTQTRAEWAGGAPTPVTGPLGRSATDVGAGTDVGGTVGDVGGPDVGAAGDVAGAGAGANASEDLNP